MNDSGAEKEPAIAGAGKNFIYVVVAEIKMPLKTQNLFSCSLLMQQKLLFYFGYFKIQSGHRRVMF